MRGVKEMTKAVFRHWFDVGGKKKEVVNSDFQIPDHSGGRRYRFGA